MPKLKNVLSGDDQFNFLIALIGLIHREGEIHISAAADRLGLSVEAVRKAMSTLVVAGHRKPSGAEVIPFNFDWELFDDEQILRFSDSDIILDAPRISTRQAAAIAAGLSYLKSLPEFASEADVDSLIDLLASTQPTPSPPTIFFEAGTVGADVGLLRRAILAELQISCNYTNQRGEESIRSLEPFRLDPRGEVWYLKAYCPVSRQIKSFRLDRMRQIVLGEHPWSDTARKAFAEFDQDEDRLYVPGESDTDVIVEVDPEAYELVSEFTTISEPNSSSGGVIRVTIKVGHLPNLGHLIAKYGGAARVISPPIARELVRNYALSALGHKNTNFERIEDED